MSFDFSSFFKESFISHDDMREAKLEKLREEDKGFGFYCEEVEEEELVFGQTEHERWERWDEGLTSTDIKKVNRSFKKIDKYVSEQALFGDKLKKMELLYKENLITKEIPIRKISNPKQRRERVANFVWGSDLREETKLEDNFIWVDGE